MDEIQFQKPSDATERKWSDPTFDHLFFPAKTCQKSNFVMTVAFSLKLNTRSLLYLPRQEQHIGKLQMK